MSLIEFRTLREELKFVPDDRDEVIQKIISVKAISDFLVTAIKALSIADEIITKQADTILHSTDEMMTCLKDMRSMNSSRNPSGSLILNSSTSIFDENILEKTDDNMSRNGVKPMINDSCVNESRSQLTPTTINKQRFRKGTPTAVESDESSYAIDDDIDNPDASADDFEKVKSRRKRTRKRVDTVIGRKPVTRLGICPRARKFEAFVSRLGPDVTIDAVQEFCRSIINEDCKVEKLKTKFSTYSSFKITCNRWKKEALLNPDSWESGVFIRPFYTSI